MIDLYFISFSWVYILVFFIAGNIGFMLSGLLAGGATAELEMRLAKSRKRIEEQTQIIFTMRKELVEAKGAASSNELRADGLERLKNDLQADYDELAKDFKDIVEEYKKLYIALDAIKAAEARKFPSPEEIVNEMLEDYKLKVSLVS